MRRNMRERQSEKTGDRAKDRWKGSTKNNIVQAEALRKVDYRNEQVVRWIKYKERSGKR